MAANDDHDLPSDWEQLAAQEREREFADRLRPIQSQPFWDSLFLGSVLIAGGFLALLIGLGMGLLQLLRMVDIAPVEIKTFKGAGTLISGGCLTIATGWAIWKGR